jgi:hypothetical protein
MVYNDASSSYENLLQAFKQAINTVLSGAVLPPVSPLFDVRLTLALLDVAHAVREERPTQYLVARACAAFTTYVADAEAKQRSEEAQGQRLKAAT